MWRYVLFVPVLEERVLAKAAQRGADAIVLDLEASIVAERKAEARVSLPSAINRLAAEGQDVLVRINMLWRTALADLEYAVRTGVKAILGPGTLANLKALEAFEAGARRGRALGSVGGVAVHRNKVEVLNRVFCPIRDRNFLGQQGLGCCQRGGCRRTGRNSSRRTYDRLAGSLAGPQTVRAGAR